ncbi:hypothetical protein IFM89_003977 [Coptis chinensis]|uniref:Uncharacterized protein n=1 Tax=Coptis chinensis TaxID=261450 RepID=A0A835LGX3_9MAGN|nr:hypothetical protein IFM89_003977 [Coptis chinensis]
MLAPHLHTTHICLMNDEHMMLSFNTDTEDGSIKEIGTLTEGKPSVSAIASLNYQELEILRVVAAQRIVDGTRLWILSRDLGNILKQQTSIGISSSNDSKTVVYVGREGEGVIGAITISDTLRHDARSTLDRKGVEKTPGWPMLVGRYMPKLVWAVDNPGSWMESCVLNGRLLVKPQTASSRNKSNLTVVLELGRCLLYPIYVMLMLYYQTKVSCRNNRSHTLKENTTLVPSLDANALCALDDAGRLVRTERLRTKDITHRVKLKNYWYIDAISSFTISERFLSSRQRKFPLRNNDMKAKVTAFACLHQDYERPISS